MQTTVSQKLHVIMHLRIYTHILASFTEVECDPSENVLMDIDVFKLLLQGSVGN